MSTIVEKDTPILASSPKPPSDEETVRSPPNLQGASPISTEAAQGPAKLPSDEEQPQASTTQKEIPTRPPFQPFFTLISDAATSTTHHPQQVHYLFEDDDTELLTAACLQAVDAEDAYEASSKSPLEQPLAASSPPDPTAAAAAQRLDRRVQENRILVLDVDASGTKIVRAHSLTPNWQILSTSLSPAPTWDTPAQGGSSEEHNMMLRIEGAEALEEVKLAGKTKGLRDQEGNAAASEEELLSLMQDFEERMKILRKVVESGEQGRVEEEEHDGEHET